MVGVPWQQPRRRGAQRRAVRGRGRGPAVRWGRRLRGLRPAREERWGFIADTGKIELAGLESGGTPDPL